MTSGPPNLNQRVNTLTGLVSGARLVWRLLQDPRVPGWLKLIPLFTVIYLISPLDLVPDVLVGPGQLDDLGILLLGLWVFLRLAPQDVLRQYAPDTHPADNGAVDVTYLHPATSPGETSRRAFHGCSEASPFDAPGRPHFLSFALCDWPSRRQLPASPTAG
jgi:uncharacterized membrane protein YkvA (DUF1232 family)